MTSGTFDPARWALAGGLLVAVLWGVVGTGPATAQPLSRDILTGDQQQIFDIQVPASDLTVHVWLDRADGRYALGQSMQMWVQTSKDAYITVLNVGTSGRTRMVFPNARHRDNYVPANQTLQLPGPNAPYSLQLGGPPGTELIKVLASTQPIDVLQASQANQTGIFRSAEGGSGQLTRDINTVVNQAPQVQWGQADKVIQVSVPGSQTPVAAVQPIQPVQPGQSVARLQVTTDKPAYRLGDVMRIFVTADRPCTLTLVNIGTTGNSTVLFPNRFHTNNQIPAGVTVALPPPNSPVQFQLGGPPGTERLIALCRTDGQTALSGQMNFQTNAFQPLGNGEAVTRDINMLQTQSQGTMAQTEVQVLVMQ